MHTSASHFAQWAITLGCSGAMGFCSCLVLLDLLSVEQFIGAFSETFQASNCLSGRTPEYIL